jgi:hypothetical protein
MNHIENGMTINNDGSIAVDERLSLCDCGHYEYAEDAIRWEDLIFCSYDCRDAYLNEQLQSENQGDVTAWAMDNLPALLEHIKANPEIVKDNLARFSWYAVAIDYLGSDPEEYFE